MHCDSLKSLSSGPLREQEKGSCCWLIINDLDPFLKRWDTHNSCTTSSSASHINGSSWNWAESQANTIVWLEAGVIWRHLGLNPASVDPQWYMYIHCIYWWPYSRHKVIQFYFMGIFKWKKTMFLLKGYMDNNGFIISQFGNHRDSWSLLLQRYHMVWT